MARRVRLLLGPASCVAAFVLVACQVSRAPDPVATAAGLAGDWQLRVEDGHGRSATGRLRFTDAAGESCMGGDWRRVEVTRAEAFDAGFFPIRQPLTWAVKDGQVIVGRNEVCDGYLHLAGRLEGGHVRGDFYALGMRGATTLGTFSLERVEAGGR